MTIVTGHRNPDMDTVCSAYCYARFKSIVDPDETYVPVRCGALNPQTKYAFARAEISPPAMLSDVYPRASDVTRTDIATLEENEPVYSAIRKLDEHTLSVVPITGENGEFRGMVSVHEISQFFISETVGERPEYLFRPANFEKVLPGRFLRRGEREEFTTSSMVGAMPYDTGIRRMRSILPKKPVFVVGLREDLVRHALDEDFPALILTGIEDDEAIPFDFSRYSGWVYLSRRDTAETIRLLRLSTPVKYIMNANPVRLQANDLYEYARDTLVKSYYRGLPVFDAERFSGMVTRRCFIERPARKLILVDHNELSQSIPGAEGADIREIIDHHRLAPEKTRGPIYVYAKPVGSTCTLVYQHFRTADVPVPPEIAILLLAGILADTVNRKSPTTTEEDILAARELSGLAGLSADSFAEEIFSRTRDLVSSDHRDVISADFKTYSEYDTAFGIGQVEVGTFENLPGVKPSLLSALEDIRGKQRLDWAMLLVTNVLKETSVLLVTEYPEKERGLVYRKIGDNLYDLPGILSRKKQLLPEILRVLEETRADLRLFSPPPA